MNKWKVSDNSRIKSNEFDFIQNYEIIDRCNPKIIENSKEL